MMYQQYKMYFLKILTIICLLKYTRGIKEFQYFSEAQSGKRFISGQIAEPHKYHYQVAIFVKKRPLNESLLCAGSLIAPNYVLTTASCIFQSSSINVVLGTYNLNMLNKVLKVNPENVIVHEDYHSPTFMNDIALVELPEIVQQTNFVKMIRLVDEEEEFSSAIVTGWGKNEFNLKKAVVDSISNLECKNFDLFFGKIISDSHLCAYGNLSEPICYFSSGSPLVINEVLIGISSFYHVNCELGYPIVFTRLSRYRNWINEKILTPMPRSQKLAYSKSKSTTKRTTKPKIKYVAKPKGKYVPKPKVKPTSKSTIKSKIKISKKPTSKSVIKSKTKTSKKPTSKSVTKTTTKPKLKLAVTSKLKFEEKQESKSTESSVKTKIESAAKYAEKVSNTSLKDVENKITNGVKSKLGLLKNDNEDDVPTIIYAKASDNFSGLSNRLQIILIIIAVIVVLIIIIVLLVYFRDYLCLCITEKMEDFNETDIEENDEENAEEDIEENFEENDMKDIEENTNDEENPES